MKLPRFLHTLSASANAGEATLIGETGFSFPAPAHISRLERWSNQSGTPLQLRALVDNDDAMSGLEILRREPPEKGRVSLLARGAHGLVALMVRSASTASCATLEDDAAVLLAQASSYFCVRAVLVTLDEVYVTEPFAGHLGFSEFAARRGVRSPLAGQLYRSRHAGEGALSFAYLYSNEAVHH